MRGPAYRFLQEVVESLREPILVATDKQLRQAIRATKRMTKTNCGWDTYWCREIIARFCADELSLRKRQAAQERRAAKKAVRHG